MEELTCCPASGSSRGLRGQLRLCTVFSGKWHSHSQPCGRFFLLALYLRGVLSSLWEGYFNFLLHQDFVIGERHAW